MHRLSSLVDSPVRFQAELPAASDLSCSDALTVAARAARICAICAGSPKHDGEDAAIESD